MLEEVIGGLRVKKNYKYIDATLGGGGHAIEIIKHGGFVLGIDVDNDSINYVKENFSLEINKSKLKIVKGNFLNIENIAKENEFQNITGIIFDLGVSSNQIDNPKRGFSYLKSGPLDMRMDQELRVKASDLVNLLGKEELIALFRRYGEEERARKLSEAIVEKRGVKAIENTDELVGILAHSYGFKNINDFAKSKSSKKVFQALRIAVNDELKILEKALNNAVELVSDNGRIVVISFHSLEDRIVKKEFIKFENEDLGKIITKKPILPSNLELKENNRSKSAKLRVFEKN